MRVPTEVPWLGDVPEVKHLGVVGGTGGHAAEAHRCAQKAASPAVEMSGAWPRRTKQYKRKDLSTSTRDQRSQLSRKRNTHEFLTHPLMANQPDQPHAADDTYGETMQFGVPSARATPIGNHQRNHAKHGIMGQLRHGSATG